MTIEWLAFSNRALAGMLEDLVEPVFNIAGPGYSRALIEAACRLRGLDQWHDK